MTIKVVVNPNNILNVKSTSVFYGSANVVPIVNEAVAISNTALFYANAAFIEANTANANIQGAYTLANTKLSLGGGTVEGNVSILGDIISNGIFYGTVAEINGGTF